MLTCLALQTSGTPVPATILSGLPALPTPPWIARLLISVHLRALIDPFVAGVGSANASSVLAAAALFDGTGTAKTINLNITFDDGDATDDDTCDVTGKIVVQWSFLADF
jgi:hypothetical protein